jgi:putative hemolysin
MSHWLAILLALIFSAFFSGMEIAFISSNRLHLELQNKKGLFPYGIISYLVKHPGKFIATLLIGNNIALVYYGQMMHEVMVPFFDLTISPYVWLLFETSISTLFILFFAEFLPKAIFRARAEEALKSFAIPGLFFYIFLFPLSTLINAISNFILKVFFKVDQEANDAIFSRVDLDHYILEKTDASLDEDIDHEIEIFKNALDFSQQKAREFMIPRTEMETIAETESVKNLKKQFINSGYSKILVFREDVDQIIGYVHAFELFKKPENLKSILRPVTFIPESMKANEVLDLLTKENRSIAVVIDEFGGTSGMLTLEDVVEELFGEIADEHDVENLIDTQLNDREFVFSARHEIDNLNTKYKLNLPESESYNTLSGMIFETTESIPEKGEKVMIGDYTFVITRVSSNRLEEVKLILPEED